MQQASVIREAPSRALSGGRAWARLENTSISKYSALQGTECRSEGDERVTKAAIRLGVVGLGRGFLLSLATLLRHPSFTIVAGADPRADARDAFVRRFRGPAYPHCSALLGDPDVEAVYIASPHGLHAEQTIAAAVAGKHVLVEKPMAISVTECMAMTVAAQRAGIVLVVGPSHGFDAQVERAAQIIASGTFGRARMVTALNFTDFLYRLRRPEELESGEGGGVVHSQAAHQFDIARRLMGGSVRSIRGVAGAWDTVRPSDGAFSALATFDNGATATITYSGYAHYDTDELMGWISELGFDKDPSSYGGARRKLGELEGRNEAAAKAASGYRSALTNDTLPAPHHEHFGFIVVSCEGADLRLTPQGIWTYANSERRLETLPPPHVPRAGAFDEFAAAIRGERVAAHDGAWGTHIVACCEALLRSSAERREVFID